MKSVFIRGEILKIKWLHLVLYIESTMKINIVSHTEMSSSAVCIFLESCYHNEDVRFASNVPVCMKKTKPVLANHTIARDTTFVFGR